MEFNVQVFLEEKTHEIVVDAENKSHALAEAQNRMGGDGMVLRVKPVSKEVSLESLKFWDKVSTSDLQVFCESLSTFVSSGLPIVSALEILAVQEENPRLQLSLREILESIKAGLPLADAFRAHSRVFPPVFSDSIEIAEESGKLVETLEELANHFKREGEIKGQVMQALTYPLVVLLVAVVVANILVFFVLPMFVEMLEQLEGDMPLPTRALIWLIGEAGMIVTTISLTLLALYFLFRWLIKFRDFRVRYEKFLLRLPVLGKLIHTTTAYTLLRSMGLMLNAGVTVLGVLRMMIKTSNKVTLQEELQEAENNVKRGNRMTDSLKNSLWLDLKTVKLLEIGEETGALDSMMYKAAEYITIEINKILNRLPTIVELVLICGLAVGVGFLLLAILLPMLEIYGEL